MDKPTDASTALHDPLEAGGGHQRPGGGPAPPGPGPGPCEEGWKIEINDPKTSEKIIEKIKEKLHLGAF